MQSERWQNCTDIFNVAAEQPREQRAALLDRVCNGDAALRNKVELLLKYHDQAGDFIASPAFEIAPEFLLDDADALIGQHLGHYRIESVLGVGGMGVVYLAHDEQLGRNVALKLLPQSLVSNEVQLERLKREARTASSLNHPNIVTIHEIGEVSGIHYIATEFIEGPTLRERMTHGPFPPNEALEIAQQIASALSVAHELTAHSPLALRITKQVLNVSLDAPREATLLLEQLAYSVLNDASALSDSPSANPAV